MRPGLLALLLISSLPACRCTDGLSGVTDAQLSVTPNALEFPDTWVGRTSALTLEVTNAARVSGHVDVALEGAGFSVEPSAFDVAGGDTVRVSVTFAPTVAGRAQGTLRVAGQAVTLSGTGLEVPRCEAASCRDVRFDFDAAVCVSAVTADGNACTDLCLATGATCLGGQCVGTAKDCSDGDACTVDACANGGCVHTDRVCPAPSAPCRVPSCDPTTGCGEQDAPDGTVCGPNSCLDANVSVCVAGQCVVRTRPQTRRCTNTWVPQGLLDETRARLAWDPVQHQVITFVRDGMWAWNGTAWRQLFPPAMPPTGAPMMTTDTRRQRVVLVPGDGTSEVWEWDGVTWLKRAIAGPTPPPRMYGGLTFDAQRRRTVLVGGFPRSGSSTVELNDTWEYDGTRWTNPVVNDPQSTTQPPPLASLGLAYDPNLQRTVLHGGSFQGAAGLQNSTATWTWDGTRWTQVNTPTTPPSRRDAPLAFDAARGAVTLVGGGGYDPLSDVWTFDGATWHPQPAIGTGVENCGVVFTPDQQRLLVLENGTLWSWDQQHWSARRETPPARSAPAASYDVNLQGLLLFSGQDDTTAYRMAEDTWVWRQRAWTELQPATHPVGRYLAAQVWDPVGQRTLLFGGSSKLNSPGGIIGQDFSDTWAFDGATWVELQPATHPPAGYLLASAWDRDRARWVAIASQAVWEFDGSQWSSVDAGPPPSSSFIAAAAYDEDHHQLLFVSRARTSTWDGVRFQELDAGLAATSDQGTAAWDGARRVVLLLDKNTTWQWDGARWVDLAPTVNIGERYSQVPLVFDAAEGRVVALRREGNWAYLP